MMIIARPLTASEVDTFTTSYSVGKTPSGLLPPYGKVFEVPLGKVLVFDAANGTRYFTLISGADSDALVTQINHAPFINPDAGLLSFLERMATGASTMIQTLTNIALIVGAIYVLRGLRT